MNTIIKYVQSAILIFLQQQIFSSYIKEENTDYTLFVRGVKVITYVVM